VLTLSCLYSLQADDTAGSCQIIEDDFDEQHNSTDGGISHVIWCNWSDNIEVINMLVKALQTSADQTEEQADAASHQAEVKHY
jgi:hypothetical protein